MKLLQQLNLTGTKERAGSGTLPTANNKTAALNQISNKDSQAKAGARSTLAKVDTNRFQMWSSIGQLQNKHSQAQGAERSLTQVYRGLLNVGQTSKTNVRHPQQTADQIRQLEAKVSHNLSGALQPKLLNAQGEQKAYQLGNIDFLTPKAAETVNLAIPAAGKSVSFHLPAYGQPQEMLDNINRALSPLKISANVTSGQKLVLSLPTEQQRMLEEPVLFSGEGIRIPAGNPVPVKLQPQGSDLSELAKIIENDQPDEILSAVKQLKAKTKNTIAQVRHFIGQLNQDAQMSMPNIDISSVEQQVGQALQQGDFGSRLTALLAQANVSRDTTVALLKKKS
ncbi:hypothetical protein [Thalassomonas actiniarum]|uniref:Uncharacterized protein n=1 Tax=Thalassomonas actiniarum TaxID=485447 RepID=A0AAE9YRW6_9GAMM|nr:hypothetical protein [Thalassomonas actiniarum]WDD99313.1 hypothetical protein SG35_001075 [Thalassomonas actiniarum]